MQKQKGIHIGFKNPKTLFGNPVIHDRTPRNIKTGKRKRKVHKVQLIDSTSKPATSCKITSNL